MDNINLDSLRFDNRFVRELPGDPEADIRPRQVTGACYSRVDPTPVPGPSLVAYSREVAADLGLEAKHCMTDEFLQVFSGNKVLKTMDPYATCYGGHQFGNWAGQLGDGRAIILGEAISTGGERRILQLKGAGMSPYSRTADGLAVLRSSVREFLCSEAMHHLGIPTTRALSIVLTGGQVIRDMFYDGNPVPEPGAIVCRVAPSFTRFGSFEIFTARGELEILKSLVDYTIRTDFPHLGETARDTYLAWYAEVCRRTAELIIHWQRVGFVHGVMNTDNMSILGLTIDYGPYGWLEDYDPGWTPNTTDAAGRRYCFGNQPQVALWNLAQLGNAIYPLIDDVKPLEEALDTYSSTFSRGWLDMMAAKLGLQAYDDDLRLIEELQAILALVETDMTIFFRQLADVDVLALDADAIDIEAVMRPLLPAYYVPHTLDDAYKTRLRDWLASYSSRSKQGSGKQEDRQSRMNAVNPRYVLRNYMAQQAIDASEQGDHSIINELLELLRQPYAEQPAMQHYYAKRPDWARNRAGCSMLS